MSDAVDLLDECLALSPSVSLRPEPFGALAYHFGNRRLTFLKRPALVLVVNALDGDTPARKVLETAGIPPEDWPAYAKALHALIESDMIRRRDVEASDG
jgi:putative mycofactocin binding protein MftB